MTAVATMQRRSNGPRLHTVEPRYELRAQGFPGQGLRLSIFELPSPSTPRLSSAECVGTLHGRVLGLVEVRLTRRLKAAGIKVGRVAPGATRTFELDEDHALVLGLLFRTLAPMRSLERIAIVADGIERMSREEAAYWLGMAIHRRNPRRVLAALRLLLTAT